jgi:hypothetical protein
MLKLGGMRRVLAASVLPLSVVLALSPSTTPAGAAVHHQPRLTSSRTLSTGLSVLGTGQIDPLADGAINRTFAGARPANTGSCTFNGQNPAVNPILSGVTPGESISLICAGFLPDAFVEAAEISPLALTSDSTSDIDITDAAAGTTNDSGEITGTFVVPNPFRAADPRAVCPPTATEVSQGYLRCGILVTDGTNGSLIALQYTTPSTPSGPTTPSSGYDLVGSDGGVFVFPTGQSGGFFGSLPGLGIHVANIVGMVPTNTDQGYFLVGSDGGVFAFGNAPFLGSLPGDHVTPTQPITGIVAANTDRGYFLVGRDGGVFAFGTVPFLGSLPGIGVHRNDIIGIAATPSGNGYWLVAADGTVYGFGAAQGLGTAKGTTSPVSAIAGTPTGGGYWITTRNGTVYPFGNAQKPSPGTLPALHISPAHPVIGIVHTSDTGGYWLIGSDGGIFAFGDAGFVGSLPGVTVHVTDVVGAVPTRG